MFVVTVGLAISAPTIINKTDATKINDYPNYLWVYTQHHVTVQLGELLSLMFFLKKYEAVQKNIKQKGSEAFNAMKCLALRFRSNI